MNAAFIIERRPRTAVLMQVPNVLHPRVVYASAAHAAPGSLLRDEAGRCYRKVGDRVWPVNGFPPPAGAAQSPAPSAVIDGELLADTEGAPAAESPAAAAHRTLWPEPGERRLIVWGRFRDVLGKQIKYPTRLRDGHRLAVTVQVYEVTRPIEVAAWRATLPTPDADLLPLTSDVAARLELRIAPSRRALAATTPGSWFAPGDRLVRLQIVSDPTAGLEGAPGKNAAGPPTASVPRDERPPADEPVSRVRRTVPERYVGPWAFVRSREDAAYECSRPRNLVRFTSAIRRCIHRADWKRWRTLLAGKTSDEQLWTVRPPAGSLSDPTLQAWATTTLLGAGYDVGVMLGEWEIFWRRKGL
ncbi:MAG TPA: hypothetical protein VD833_14810 [Vicinamibacterales bacterium]|nr:hypothetical protein [Vicinamibacterales bacterium]